MTGRRESQAEPRKQPYEKPSVRTINLVAEEVLEAMDAEIARVRNAGITVTREARSVDYSEGIRHYLGGEPELGLPLIERAIRDGYTLDVHIPYLQSLVDDPAAQPIRGLFEEIQTRERRKLLKRVCDDNPYRDIWQPAEATCAEIR